MLGSLVSQVAISTSLKAIGSGFRTVDAAKTHDKSLLLAEVKQEASLLGIVGTSTLAFNTLLTKFGVMKAFPKAGPTLGIAAAYFLGEYSSRVLSGIRNQLNRSVNGVDSAPQHVASASVSIPKAGQPSGFSLFAGNPNQLQSSMSAAGGNYQPAGFTQVANTFQRIA